MCKRKLKTKPKCNKNSVKKINKQLIPMIVLRRVFKENQMELHSVLFNSN